MMLPLRLVCCTTALSAELMLVSWQSLATTSTIFAPGASPWDMVTSSVVSSHHPTAPHAWSIGRLGSNTGHLSLDEPVHVGPHKMVTLAAGRPNVLSNVFKSLCIVGLPKASTMTIV